MKKAFHTALCTAIAATSFAAPAGDVEPNIQRFAFSGLEAPVFYNAESPLEAGSKCEIAVVHVHGWGSGVGIAKEEVPLTKALKAACGPDATPPYVISPLFPRRAILKHNKEPVDGRAIWNDSWTGSLAAAVGPNDDWRGGGDATGTHLSSYDVIDLIFATLSDRAKFPNLKRVVMTGYSAGGQFVGRYAAVGKGIVREGITLEYAAMAPSTELRLDPDVSWHYGLKNRPRYSAALTFDQILGNLSRRRVWRGCGDADTKGPDQTALDVSPYAIKQGKNRYERFLNFKEYLKQFPAWEKQVSFYTFKGMSHNNAAAHSSPALISFIVGQP
jgi:hypothetical protein